MGWVYSGYINDDPIAGVGAHGMFWTSTANYADEAYYLVFDSGTWFGTTSKRERHFGFPIRGFASFYCFTRSIKRAVKLTAKNDAPVKTGGGMDAENGTIKTQNGTNDAPPKKMEIANQKTKTRQ